MWAPAFDEFVFQRFPDCVWMSGDPMCNRNPYWLNLSEYWFPTHWMPIPKGPIPPFSPGGAPMSLPAPSKKHWPYTTWPERRVVRVDKAPLNPKVKVAQLDCGHDAYRTRAPRIGAIIVCEKCAEKAGRK
jgi:hypothetical protein